MGDLLNNRHRLESEIGRGCIGVVYLGWYTQLDRRVAAKVLPGDRRRSGARPVAY